MQLGTLDTYFAVLTMRHPNVSGSFVMIQFHLSLVPDPAAAAAPAANDTSTPAVTAASLALFNPLVNPRLGCTVTLPRITLSTYIGGSSKLLRDFNSIVASNAALDGPAWVQSSLTNSTPVTISAAVSYMIAAC